tara:strand:- start:2180 stop:2623 length:444 start_codon:yes stop_codon:yes gene_type:complete
MPIKGMDNVKKMIAKNKKDSNIKLYAIFFDGLSEVIKETPVDKGRVRNNWFLTKGQPFSMTSGRSEDKSGSGSISSLSAMPESVLNKKLYFTNNMPYIETLEFGGYPNPSKGKKTSGGYSKQLIPFNTPKGWVRSNLIRMRNKVRSL